MITYAEFWIFATCLLGAVQCFLLAGNFSLMKTGNTQAHRLFALLMLLIGIRLLKSAHYIFIGESMPLIWMNLGFLAHFAAGPLAFLYIRSHLGHAPRRREYQLHFLPSVVLLVLSPWLSTENFWYVGGYRLLLLYTLFYFGYATYLWLRAKPALHSPKIIWWIPSLLFGVGTFFLAYFSNYILRLIPYATAPVLYSLAVIPISLSAWKNHPELSRSEEPVSSKYENLSLDQGQLSRIKQRILHLLDTEKPFLEPNFNLAALSECIDTPSHQISMTLNQFMDTSFPVLVNEYRIREACCLLRSPDHQHYTIAAIAFEAGFNSLSVFNQHFKLQTGITPSVYRKAQARPG